MLKFLKNIMLLLIVLYLPFVLAQQEATDVDSNKSAAILTAKAQFKDAYSSYKTFSEQGKWEESLEHAKKVYELGAEVYADKPETRAILADNYGLNLMKLEQFKQATSVFLEALNLYEKLYGIDSLELILPLMDASRSLVEYKNGNQFKKHLQRAITISKTQHDEASAEHGQMLVESSLIFAKAGQVGNVNRYLKKGHGILYNTLGEDHPRTGIAAYNIGSIAYFNEQYNKATKYLEAALKSFEFPDQPTNQYELKTHSLLIGTYERLNQRDKATKHCLAIGRMTPRTPVQDYRPLLKIAPIYPQSAAASGTQGEVTVQYSVDESGFVVNPVVIKNTTRSKALERSSIEAALKFRYAPGFVDGKPVVTEGVKNRFTYELSW